METERLCPAPLTRVAGERAQALGAGAWPFAFRRWYFATWPLGIAALWAWSPTAAAGHFLATHVMALYGALRANSQVFGPVVQRFEPRGREVWLTIDDGPFPTDTTAFLRALDAHRAHATFFVEGRRVRRSPDLARRIAAAGHSFGNHSDSHAVGRFWAAGPRSARRELGACSEAIRVAVGVEPVGFRPPVGMANGFVHLCAAKLGLPMVGWSARGYDGLDRDSGRVVARLLGRIEPGAILLLHQRPDERANAATLQRALERLDELGYRCVLPDAAQFLPG